MKRALWVVLYAIAMAAVESAVVVYLRALHTGPELVTLLAYQLPDRLVAIEVGREVATLVMLVAIAALAAQSTWERFLYLALAFGVWDIFYYVWLWVFIGWPPSLFTWDILFLIPVPWLGPVLAPVIVSLCLVAGSLWLLSRPAVRLSRRAWALALAGGVLVLLSFMVDYRYVLARTDPPRFRWELFWAGIIIGVGGVLWDRLKDRTMKPLLFILLFACTSLQAQTPIDTLRQLDSAWARSYATNDTVLGGKLFDDSLIVTGGNGRLKGKKGELADVGPTPGGQIHYFRTRDVVARAYGSAGVVIGLAEWSYTFNGRTNDYRRRYTAVYARGGPLGWRMVSLHIGPAPDQ